MKACALLASLFLLGSGCTDPEPTLLYQYEVQGSGEEVSVSYFAQDQKLTEERVSLPWTSDEFEGTGESLARLKVDGPEGATVRCIVRRRSVDGAMEATGPARVRRKTTRARIHPFALWAPPSCLPNNEELPPRVESSLAEITSGRRKLAVERCLRREGQPQAVSSTNRSSVLLREVIYEWATYTQG